MVSVLNVIPAMEPTRDISSLLIEVTAALSRMKTNPGKHGCH
jgi:hypothetical protein